MGDGFRWAVVRAAPLALFGPAAYARGTQHHCGDDGTHAAKIIAVPTEAA